MWRTTANVGLDVALIKPTLNMVDHDAVENGLEADGLLMCTVLELVRKCRLASSCSFSKPGFHL